MIPDGDLLRSRVVTDLSPALEDVFERKLDGYARLSPRDMLLASEEESGIITFENGVSTVVYHAGTDRGGPPAIDDIGSPPYQFELYALDADALEFPHRVETLSVAPGTVAERLAGDPDLASRIRTRATEDERDDPDSVEAFLEDETAVNAIRQSARENALERADEWGFEDAVGE